MNPAIVPPDSSEMVKTPRLRRRPGLIPDRFGPSVPDLVFVFLGLAVTFLLTHRLLNSDGDLGRHLRVGEYILDRGSLFYQDPFSYTRVGTPFVPFEWLSEVLFAISYRAGGLAGVAVFSALLIALTYFVVGLFLRNRGVEPFLAYVVTMLAAVLGSMHWLARPHLFTLLGSALLLTLLERQPDRRRPWLFLPLFVLWANLHGGFLFGLVLIGVYVVSDLLAARFSPHEQSSWLEAAQYHGAGLLVATFATFLNPSGPGALRHVIGYLGETFLVARTEEYLSPDFHVWTGRVFLGVLLLLVAVMALGRSRYSIPGLLVVLVTLAFALHSKRNIPLFGLTALPLVAISMDAEWRQLPGRFAKHVRGVFAVDGHRSAGGWAAGTALLLALLGLAHGSVLGIPLVRARFDPAVFPIEAVNRSRAAGMGGRLFNDFSWGGYVLHAWPEQKVFIDGQTDLYGEALARQYLQVEGLQPGWREVLDRWRVSTVLVPTGSPLAAELARAPEWRVWHRDPTAVVLLR